MLLNEINLIDNVNFDINVVFIIAIKKKQRTEYYNGK